MPSITTLEKLTLPKNALRNANVLVVANPIDPSVNFARNYEQPSKFRTGWRFETLPFAEIEAEYIKRLYPDTKILKHEQATQAALLQEKSQYEIIHIASHGFVDTTFDAFSGLILSTTEDSTDDGLLMGYEISDLNLKSDLITLSACETGRGRVVSGEGVLALPRLFLGSGAKSVLLSHWKTDDKFTSEFMGKFYSYLRKGLSKSEALSSAKREIIDNASTEEKQIYQHPFFWASFTLYGDPGVEQSASSVLAWVPLLFLTLLIIAFLAFWRKKVIPRHGTKSGSKY